MFPVKTTINITNQRVEDLLTSAFEGGSNYWVKIKHYIEPKNYRNTTAGNLDFLYMSFPMNEGGSLVLISIEDKVEKEYKLDLQSIQSGLTIMAEKYTACFNEFVANNEDANTGDVFLQCCLFEKVIYG